MIPTIRRWLLRSQRSRRVGTLSHGPRAASDPLGGNLRASDEEEVRIRLRIVAQTPTLRAGLASTSAASAKVIADALITGEASRTVAVIAAGAVMGALNTALLEWSVTEDVPLGSAILAALDILEGHRA